MYPAPSEAKNRTVSAISSGLPKRFSGARSRASVVVAGAVGPDRSGWFSGVISSCGVMPTLTLLVASIALAPRPGLSRSSAFALGAGIMALELPTALMYFGAISAVLASHQSAAVQVLLLVVYNALFVAPIVAILVIRQVAGERAERWLASAWGRVVGFGQLALAGLTGGGGAALLIIGVTGLLSA